MTYISKKEKVFDLPEQEESSSTSLNQSEATLKRFPSVQDRRAWTSEEFQRYQHLYGLVNGSEVGREKKLTTLVLSTIAIQIFFSFQYFFLEKKN